MFRPGPRQVFMHVPLSQLGKSSEPIAELGKFAIILHFRIAFVRRVLLLFVY